MIRRRYIAFAERLTPEEFKRFKREMANLRRRFRRRMRRLQEAKT